jgi:lipopolysaccharide biosynthesis protein
MGQLRRAVSGGSVDLWRASYIHAFEVARHLRSPDFAAPPLSPPRRDPDGPVTVAFYLPQFHPIPENDAWWGRGFTEWTNVTKATPQFAGHLQPRLPADLGHYDLRVPEVRRAQVDLARRIGVDAFCFHYYWFAGKRVLERPLDEFVADESVDFPFALCWANENWTRRWDGQDNEVLLAQAHSPEDDLAVFDDLARYMRHPRYLKSEGRPLLLVYRPDILPDPTATAARWRARARELGLGELFLLCSDAFGFSDYRRFGFDGLVEFPPHAISIGEIGDRVELLNPAFAGRVYDYGAVVEAKVGLLAEREDPRMYPSVMTAWDNEARKPGAGHVFHHATPDGFRRWSAAALDCTLRLAPAGERFVFINAWNEWAEGTYLEPDRWFGHGFGQGLRTALEARAPRIGSEHPLVRASEAGGRRCDAVVLLHLYYPELIDDFAAHLEPETGRLDLDVTFPEQWSEAELARLAAAMPHARLTPVPNAGRDVAPFLGALRRADAAGYPVFCKLHSKRSPHLSDGDAWRGRLLGELAGPEAIDAALERFAREPTLGLLAAERSMMRLGEPGVLHNNRHTLERLSQALSFQYDDETPFAAGSMFWGRTTAFLGLNALADSGIEFEAEMGRIDGTLAHALERAMAAIVLQSGREARFDL